jgi:uncharacterized protein
MAAYNSIELGRIVPRPGDGRRIEIEIEPGGVDLGGHAYEFTPETVLARLELSATASGYAMRLAFEGEIEGPCMRCLATARVPVVVEAREVDQRGTDDEELRSPYVGDGELDIAAWAHDALVLDLPAQIFCRPDCAGLCVVCGVSLNDAEPGAHDHPSEPDPRWDKLRELQ